MVREVIYLASKIFLSFILPMKTPWLTVNGRVNAYQPRQSGNSPQERSKKITFTFGEMMINFSVLKQTLGMAFFQLKIQRKMAIPIRHQYNPFLLMPMDYTIWPEMYGNGLRIGTIQTTMLKQPIMA